MFVFFKNILFSSVLIVILLHTFIPHPHSDEMTIGEHTILHNNSNTLFDIISIAFHESDNNLDNFIFSQYDNVKEIDYKQSFHQNFIFENNTSISGKVTAEKVVKEDSNNFDRLFFVKQNRLRGPPQLV